MSLAFCCSTPSPQTGDAGAPTALPLVCGTLGKHSSTTGERPFSIGNAALQSGPSQILDLIVEKCHFFPCLNARVSMFGTQPISRETAKIEYFHFLLSHFNELCPSLKHQSQLA